MATANQFDAIVVGSGMSGGWAAKELTEKGLKTLVLERGRNIRHVTDYTTALKDPWQLPHNNRATNADRAAQPIQSTLYLYDQSTKQHFVNDLRASLRAGAAIQLVSRLPGRRALAHVGAARVPLQRSRLRRPTSARAWASTGRSATPTSRPGTNTSSASSAPAVRTPGLPQLPEQILQPPFEMNALEKHIRSHMAEKFGSERKLICSATAVLSREHNGRGPCQGRNQCARGCPFSAYFSSNGVTLPAAAATGQSHAAAGCHRAFADLRRRQESRDRRARRRRQHAQDHRVLREGGVPVRLDAELHRAAAQHAFGALSRTGSATTAASSATISWITTTVAAPRPATRALPDRYYRGRRATSMYIPRFRNVGKREEKFMRGYGYEVYTSAAAGRAASTAPTSAPTSRTRSRGRENGICTWKVTARRCRITTTACGCRLSKLDSWGMPIIQLSMTYRDNERAMAQQMMDDAVEMMQAAKLENVTGLQQPGDAGQRDPRDGHGAHGPRSEDLGAERAQPGSRGAQCVRDRRQLHGVVTHAESVAHLHGADGARGQPRGGAVEARRVIAAATWRWPPAGTRRRRSTAYPSRPRFRGGR